MKQMKLRIFFMAALLAASSIVTACGDAADTKAPVTTAAEDSAPVTEAVTEDPRIPSALPADLDLGGETINVWYFTKNSDAAERFLDLVGDPEGDIVEASLYERNMAVEEQLNMTFNYVDTGVLHTEVDGIPHVLGEKELIIYGPGQFHAQHTDAETASYVTIMFNMENISPDLPQNWYSVLINQVFPYNKKIYTLIKALVQESSTGAPYTASLMHCLLTETIIRLLQGVYSTPTAQPSSVVRQNYQEELFDRILEYVHGKLYEPLTVADICQQFSISRSTLQLLFKNAVNQSPKKYISDMKLEKSCQMLRENKYTISEISLKLGYSSIHYFSNAFNQKYHISPSEYAKRIY